MAQKKIIAIVGATEKNAAVVVNTLAKGNYRLLLMGDDEGQLSKLKRELANVTAEIETIQCAKDACWEADMIIVASPYEKEKEVAAKIKEVATGKIVISVSNPFDSSYEKLFPSPNNSAAEELQRLLPYSKVVKTFNTSVIEKFSSGDTLIAGNNSDAIETVSELIKTVGFNPLVVGDLSMSRALERMQLLLAQKSATQFNHYLN